MLLLVLVAQLLTAFIPPSPAPSIAARRPLAYSLLIESKPDMGRTAFLIRVQRGPRVTKLVYARRDSIKRYSDPVQDSLIRELKAMSAANPQLPGLIHAAGSRLIENQRRYGAYTQDSITLKNAWASNRAYIALLDSVFRADDAAFRDYGSARTVNGRHSVVLHATAYRLYRQATGLPERKAYMTAPDSHTNPLFVRLLTQTLALYRHNHPDSFMAPRYTRDY
ncbi:hypothetical protein [Hymenobacter latericus]|uniref:hypothetical protein n=1 Tax=Hymenobacter sp. YIM 151858-1 TaxID=2987688 RepID=UPI00222667B6|nr:hypothetical protein [Hymenobacter sp. YIM 151858-1]UYZ57387.1 hypothetical protein OIS50_09920 [Hymenobacter sp. YIM 151858-1]